jgi:hypothetical protein
VLGATNQPTARKQGDYRPKAGIKKEGLLMDIMIGNSIKTYSTSELIEELKRRGDTNIIVVDSPSINYYVNVPAMNKEIKGCINGFTREKVLISVTVIK